MTNDQIRLWLDASDKLIKAAAVFIGGAWTWWNYRKTRPHALKLEVAIAGQVFFKDAWFISATISAKNTGTTQLNLHSEGTVCELFAIFEDMSERQLDAVELTVPERPLASGEAVQDHFQWKVPTEIYDVLWFRIQTRVVAGKLQWRSKELVRALKEIP